jgi:hypothetical protein
MKEYIKGRFQKIGEVDQVETSLKITLVLFLFSEWIRGDSWQFFAPIVILAGLGLILPNLYKKKYLWYILAFTFTLKTVSEWWFQDNHLFVNTYWVIAIAFALSFKDFNEVLAKNARMMLGLVFLFAIVWKFISPDFISGAYFHYSFLTDIRFSEEASLLGNISREDISNNISKLHEVGSVSIESTTLTSSDAIKTMTQVITWHTIIIELLLAVLFLLPHTFKLSRYRNYVLIAFVLTTYLAMPIDTFAWLIIAVGISQTQTNEKTDRAILIACLPITMIYKYVPFMQWLVDYI